MTDKAIDYIRHVMQAKGWTAAELARAAGVSHSTINRPITTPGWKSAISRQTIERVQRASGISPAPFIGNVTLPMAIEDASLVPIYAVQASAGHGALVTTEDIVDRLAFPPDYLRQITKSHPRHLAIISVKGDSMAPTLKDDDLVMIDTSKTDLSYEGLFVIKIDGGSALLVKRIGRASRRGYVNVISDNEAHPAVEIVAEDVIPVGKVVWAGVRV